jgi:hypothetical protein
MRKIRPLKFYIRGLGKSTAAKNELLKTRQYYEAVLRIRNPEVNYILGSVILNYGSGTRRSIIYGSGSTTQLCKRLKRHFSVEFFTKMKYFNERNRVTGNCLHAKRRGVSPPKVLIFVRDGRCTKQK